MRHKDNKNIYTKQSNRAMLSFIDIRYSSCIFYHLMFKNWHIVHMNCNGKCKVILTIFLGFDCILDMGTGTQSSFDNGHDNEWE